MAQLTVITGNLEGQSFQLKEGQTTIGRKPDCDVHLDDPSVSGHHCTINVENGIYTVKDSGSTNGTRINQEEVQERSVQFGDILNVGSVNLKLESGDMQPGSLQPPENKQQPEQPQVAQAPPDSVVGFYKRRDRKTIRIIITVLLALIALAALACFLLTLFA